MTESTRRQPLRTAAGVALALAVAACAGSSPTAEPGSTRVEATQPADAATVATDLTSPVEPASEPTPDVQADEDSTAPALTTDTSTTGPEPDQAAPSTSASPLATCAHDDEWVITPSGRRVLLRTNGATSPAPTVLVIHGYTGTPTGIERVSNMTVDAAGTGVVVAYPEGSPVEIGGLGWNTGAQVFAAVDTPDVEALADMVDAIVATGCVDRSRLTISGESNGGGMTLAAICSPQLATTFQHAVMVIPGVDDGVLERCGNTMSSDTALTAVAGLIDRTAPFDGGNGLLAQPTWFTSVAISRGCSEFELPTPLTDFVTRTNVPGCGPCTELLVVADGPHTWPGSPEGNGDLVAGTFDLNRRIIADLLDDDTRCISER